MSLSAENSPTEKKPAASDLGGLQAVAWAVFDFFYPICYRMGIRTMRLWHMMARSWKKAFMPWKRLAVRLWKQHVWRHVLHWGKEWKRFFLGFPLAFRRIGEAWKRHPLTGIWYVICMPFVGIYRHRKGLMTLVNLLAPLTAAYAMVSVIHYWGSATFALELEYKGQTVGYIADESVFDMAVTLAEGRVANVDNSFTVERTPTMTVALAQEDELLSQTELCDLILRSYGNAVTPLSGVYVDNRFIGAVDSTQKMQALLQAILDSRWETEYENNEVSFLQQVELVDGLYPVSARLSMEEVRTMLTDREATTKWYTVKPDDTLTSIAEANGLTRRQLLQLNTDLSAANLTAGQNLVVQAPYAYLDIQVVRVEKREESIPYETETVSDPNRFVGDNYIKVEGEYGVRTITDYVVYVDGKEISRSNLSVETTKEPVTEVYAKGAYNVNTDARPGVAIGRFIWPVPSSYNIICGYMGYPGHYGVDIGGARGAALLAVDGGVVVEVNYSGWGQGWGAYVLVDHGNGYMTRYAHCSSVLVNYGDYVTQGQLIARMGDTGYADGVHLHFEVYYNGSRINPQPFLP